MNRTQVAIAGTSSVPQASTVTEVIPRENTTTDPPVLRLQLRRPKNDKKVAWSRGTVDNENMGKKKSKCCCIYKKPHEFGESSSDSEEEDCEHCFGHVENKKKKKPLSDDENHTNCS